jgi:hypothetical protein
MSEGAEADGLDLEAISSGEADAGHGHGGAKMEGVEPQNQKPNHPSNGAEAERIGLPPSLCSLPPK